MKNLIFICLALNLSGCTIPDYGERDPTNREWAILTKGYDTWEENINSIDSECSIEFTKIKIYSSTNKEEISSICGSVMGRKSEYIGCFAGIEYNLNSQKYIIFYWESAQDIPNVIYHEFSHWAEYCQTGNTGNHSNKIVWDLADSNPL